MRRLDFLFVVAAAVLWGGGGVVGTLFGDHIGAAPLEIAAWRMSIAGVGILVSLAATRHLNLLSTTRAMWQRILVTGALTAAFEAAFFTAISLAGVGLATLVGIASAPMFVATFDAVSLRAMPARRSLVALVLAAAGLALVMGGSLVGGPHAAVGTLIALGAGVAFAAITIVNRAPVPGLGPVPLTGWSFACGAVLLVPFAAIGSLAVPRDATGWGLALALGLGITALAYVAFLAGLRTVPPFVATIVSLLEPLVAALLGALVLAERLGPTAVVGGGMLVGAVILLRPQRDEPESIH